MEEQKEVCGICKTPKKIVGDKLSPENEKILILECIHEVTAKIKNINEGVGISDNENWKIVKDPVGEVQRLVRENDYFMILAYPCAIFDYCGKRMLKWHSEKTGTRLAHDWDCWDLEKVIRNLFSRKIMTDTNFETKLIQIKDLRNSFVHGEHPLYLTSEKAKEVRDTTDDIIACTKFIYEKYEQMGGTNK